MLDWWTEVGLATSSFLDRHGLLAAFVFLLIEEAGVPVPVPGDVLMLILGVHARQGSVPLWQAVMATWAGTMIGSTLLYVGSHLAGRNLVYRYGHVIRLTPERLDTAERWLKRHGSRAVFLGRLVPGLRIVTAVACGVFEVPFSVFFPAMSIGALLYILVYTLVGYLVGPSVLRLLEKVHIPFGLLGSLLPLAVILVWIVRARQDLARRGATRLPRDFEQQVRAGAVAGGLATIASTLMLNAVINLAGNFAFNAPGTIVEQTAARLAFALARDVQPLLLFVAVPAYLGVGILWGAGYAVWAESSPTDTWPDWLKGLTFAIGPLLFSLLLAMPLLGLGFLGVGATGPVAASGELIRHAAFGAVLGLTYPVFRVKRSTRAMAQPPEAEEAPAARSAGAEA